MAPFSKCTTQQWRFGAVAIKPTTFLYANISLPQELDRGALPNAVKPQTTLIGLAADGQFATAAAKEYPSALNKCFASAFGSRIIDATWLRNCQLRPDLIGFEFAQLAARVERSTWLPDYQPLPV